MSDVIRFYLQCPLTLDSGRSVTPATAVGRRPVRLLVLVVGQFFNSVRHDCSV